MSLLDVQKTAEKLGISEATVRNWSKLGIDQDERTSKLKSRANKRQSQRLFSPQEYCSHEKTLCEIDRIVAFATQHELDTATVVYLVAARFTEKCKNPHCQRELTAWKNEIGRVSKTCSQWFETLSLEHLHQEGDFLGLLYQSLLSEGTKAKKGVYYTPQSVVREMIAIHCKTKSNVLDPACGTGQFLLEAANVVADPTQLYGIDNDPIAVRICRINLMLRFPEIPLNPNVICADSLFDFHTHSLFDEKDSRIPTDFFDLVTTNPPWGAHYSSQQKKQLAKRFPQVRSGESYSYFLLQAARFAKKRGVISFVLPESLLNIKVHSDVRDFLVEQAQVKKITELGRIFSGVFTPVIRLDLINAKPKQKPTSDSVFSVFQNEKDKELLEKIYVMPSVSLKNHAKFALGIVTGNNEKHLLEIPTPKSEPIFRGKDVDLFLLKPNSEYIVFAPDQFQQVAQESVYRAEEKLIYRFICKDLIFAYDAQQRLTLNSANILIPNIPDYPAKVVCAALNSDVMRFVYRKKFNALKVLRGNLEELPIPDLSGWEKKTILNLVDRFLKTRKECIIEEINRLFFEHFQLDEEEREYIVNFLKNN